VLLRDPRSPSPGLDNFHGKPAVKAGVWFVEYSAFYGLHTGEQSGSPKKRPRLAAGARVFPWTDWRKQFAFWS
jgi:hypothetical protein